MADADEAGAIPWQDNRLTLSYSEALKLRSQKHASLQQKARVTQQPVVEVPTERSRSVWAQLSLFRSPAIAQESTPSEPKLQPILHKKPSDTCTDFAGSCM